MGRIGRRGRVEGKKDEEENGEVGVELRDVVKPIGGKEEGEEMEERNN